eukprot:COSAG06_NODE_975_length_11240_cov_14.650296_6_plen_40_part_00
MDVGGLAASYTVPEHWFCPGEHSAVAADDWSPLAKDLMI